MSSARSIKSFDFTGPRERFGKQLVGDHDLDGHGTAVARILDAILPSEVQLVSGLVMTNDPHGITVLRVATAFAHLVGYAAPVVVNLSLAPRDDVLICPYCNEAVPVEAFHSLILPFVFRLATGVMTIMAAGNRAQISNARHALAGTDRLVLVEAEDSEGRLAAYSNRVDTRHVAVARAYGGDDPAASGKAAVYQGDPNTFGTSFASPFIAAAAFAYRTSKGHGVSFDADPTGGFGAFCTGVLGASFHFQPALTEGVEQIPVPA